MKSILLCCLFFGLMFSPVVRPVQGANDPLKAVDPFKTAGKKQPPLKQAPVKYVPQPGRFEIKVTMGDKVKSFPHPAKALSEIIRAVGRAKKAKEGDAPAFEAALTLNDQVFTFGNPEAALEACKTLSTAMRSLPKLKMGLGDLGEIPAVKPEDQAAAGPMGQAKQIAGMMVVRQRIQVALQRQMGSRRGRYGIPQAPNPAAMQQIIAQEIQKAQAEGLLPAAPMGNAGFAGGDPREAQKESIVQTLAFAFCKADSVGKPESKPAETK